jgi:hypothetical protein
VEITAVYLVDAAHTWRLPHGSRTYPILFPAFRLEEKLQGSFGSDVLILTESPPDTRTVNYDILRRRLEACRSGKGGHWICSLSQRRALPPQALRVIDCESRELVELSSKESGYVTLSYVWGQVTGELPLVLQKLPDEVPKVVSDAILVVLGLGFRYLWIDRYCIPQADEAEKTRLVAGDGPDHGLPGVSTTERSELRTLQVGSCSLVYAKRPAEIVQSSKWATRGWTYQEGALAIRRLVFASEQVYFQCQVSHSLEISPLPYEDKYYETHPFNLVDYQQSFSLEQKSGAFANGGDSKLHRHFEDFFERDLTFEGDVLKAMAGFSRPNSFMGLPILTRQSFESSVEPPNDMERFSMENLAFAIALSWNIQCAVVRREGFPTWTWAGWKPTMAAAMTTGAGGGSEMQWCLRFQCLSFPWKYRTMHDHSFKELHSTASFSLRFGSGIEMEWKTDMKKIVEKAWEEGLGSCDLQLCAEGWTFNANLMWENGKWVFPSPTPFTLGHGQGGSIGSLGGQVENTVTVKCLVLHLRYDESVHSVVGLMFLLPKLDSSGAYERVGYGQFCVGAKIETDDGNVEELRIQGMDVKRERITVV